MNAQDDGKDLRIKARELMRVFLEIGVPARTYDKDYVVGVV